jgi:hypothetical protein
LNASSPFFISARRCAVRLAPWVVVVMRAPLLVCGGGRSAEPPRHPGNNLSQRQYFGSVNSNF